MNAPFKVQTTINPVVCPPRIVPYRVSQDVEKESNEIQNRIRIICQDVAQCERLITSEATAVFIYLVPSGLKTIRPILEKVRRKSKCRILSYLFSVPEWEPDEIGRSKGNFPLFLYKSNF